MHAYYDILTVQFTVIVFSSTILYALTGSLQDNDRSDKSKFFVFLFGPSLSLFLSNLLWDFDWLLSSFLELSEQGAYEWMQKAVSSLLCSLFYRKVFRLFKLIV